MNYINFQRIFFDKKAMSSGIFVLSFVALIFTLSVINKPHVYRSDAYKNLVPSHEAKVRVRRPLHLLKRISASQLSLRTQFSPLTTQFAGYSPDDIKKAYNLPATGGSGTIAIIDFFDTPSAEHDLNVFSAKYNLPACTTANGCFTVVYPSGKPSMSSDPGTGFETDLDIEWAHAIAPNARILLIEALSDQIADIVPVLDFTRNEPNLTAVSMSFGTNEFAEEINLEPYFQTVSGAMLFAASGDFAHGVFWPAASPQVTSVGGTSLTINGNLVTESAWNLSGGGVSAFLQAPVYQIGYPVQNAQGKRAVPDVAVDADPATGVVVYGPDGSWRVYGGTSLGAPIWAGISTLGTIHFTDTLLYQNAKNHYSSYYRDITIGSNGTCAFYCTAQNNYDFITGLGSPVALPVSSGNTPTPTQTLSLTPTPTTMLTGTNFFVTVGLHGIANGGDNVHANAKGNRILKHPTRLLTVAVTDLQNHQVQQSQGTITFDSPSGFFKGFVDLGSLPTGDYKLTFAVNGFLVKSLIQIVHSTQGQTTNLPVVFLVNGDVNNDDQLDIRDYSAFINCFGTKQYMSSCLYPPGPSAGSDFDDSGIVDGADYNLFVRELSVQPGN